MASIFTLLTQKHSRYFVSPRPAMLSQTLDIAEGMLRDYARGMPLGEEAAEAIAIYAIAWGVGSGLTEQERVSLDARMRDNLAWNMPGNGTHGDTIYHYRLVPTTSHSNLQVEWQSLPAALRGENVPLQLSLKSFPTHSLSDLVIPTRDSVAILTMLRSLPNTRPILIGGGRGSGKQTLISQILSSFTNCTARIIHMNRNIGPDELQSKMQNFLRKTMAQTYSPAEVGKHLKIVCTDVGIVATDQWGSCKPQELLRQVIQCQGAYSLEKPGEWLNFKNTGIIASVTTTSGTTPMTRVDARFQGCFHTVQLSDMNSESLRCILSEMYSGRKPACWTEKHIVGMTIELWEACRALPSYIPAAKSWSDIHPRQIFSAIANVMHGAARSSRSTSSTLICLWRHECEREVLDRQMLPDRRKAIEKAIQTIIEAHSDRAARRAAAEL